MNFKKWMPVVAMCSVWMGMTTSATYAQPVARPMKPLNTVNVPLPSNIDDFVKDRELAIALGKALFWDMQVGSDGKTACATCHFHAGSDARIHNTLGLPKDNPNKIKLRNPISKLAEWQFPFTRVDRGPLDPAAVVYESLDEVVGSKGVELRDYNTNYPWNPVDVGTVKPDPNFNFHGANLRTVTSRNSPTVINAVFNHRNDWDGRASYYFNGVNQYGKFDADASVLQVSFSYANSVDALYDKLTGTRTKAIQNVQKVKVLLDNASLASQSTAPPLVSEMSWEGRTFPELGRKMMNLRPLAKQEVYFTDSSLAPYDVYAGNGLWVMYPEFIRRAFHEKWWGSTKPTADGYTQMEENFSLFWGISLLMYQRTLVSDDTPVDRFLAGDTSALNQAQQTGLNIFQRGCNICHSGPETTAAAIGEIVQADGTQKPIQIMLRGAKFDKPTFYDRGYYNTGVRKTANDLGAGGKDSFGLFSLTLRAKAGQDVDQKVFEAPIQALPVAIDGTFKTPTLRNVELTGPYMHNGGMLFLDQVIEFYGRGADFRNENVQNLDQGVSGIAGFQDPNQGPIGVSAVVAFMNALTDERVRNQEGPFDHPQLLLPEGVSSVSNGTALENFKEFPAVGRYGVYAKFWGTMKGEIIKPFHQVLRESL